MGPRWLMGVSYPSPSAASPVPCEPPLPQTAERRRVDGPCHDASGSSFGTARSVRDAAAPAARRRAAGGLLVRRRLDDHLRAGEADAVLLERLLNRLEHGAERRTAPSARSST